MQTFPYTARVNDTKQNIFGTMPEIASLKTFFFSKQLEFMTLRKNCVVPWQRLLACEAQLKLVKLGNAVYDNDTLASVACDTPASVVCDNLAIVVCDTPASVVCDTPASVVCDTLVCDTLATVVCDTLATVVCDTLVCDTIATVVCDTLATVVCDTLAAVVCDTLVCDTLASVACRLRLFILCKLFTRVPGEIQKAIQILFVVRVPGTSFKR